MLAMNLTYEASQHGCPLFSEFLNFKDDFCLPLKEFCNKENTRSAAADNGCTSITSLQTLAQAGILTLWAGVLYV